MVFCFAKTIFEILFTLFYNFLTNNYIEQLRLILLQCQFFKRMIWQNVDVNHKSQKKFSKNIFSFDIALIMNLFKNGLRAGWVLVLGLSTGPVTINALDVPGLGQLRLEKC